MILEVCSSCCSNMQSPCCKVMALGTSGTLRAGYIRMKTLNYKEMFLRNLAACLGCALRLIQVKDVL